jgi:uncharacterized Tic20 family protein
MKDEKTLALLAHLSGLFFSFLGPLLIWAIKKDESKFIREHSLEALNFQISVIIYFLAATFSMIILIGFLILPILIVLEIIFVVMACIAANKGEVYKYPFTLRLIN